MILYDSSRFSEEELGASDELYSSEALALMPLASYGPPDEIQEDWDFDRPPYSFFAAEDEEDEDLDDDDDFDDLDDDFDDDFEDEDFDDDDYDEEDYADYEDDVEYDDDYEE